MSNYEFELLKIKWQKAVDRGEWRAADALAREICVLEGEWA